jgi:hypothetical protein
MSAEAAIGHLRALWRTERIIADIRLKSLLGSLGFKAFAALFAACGLLLFELAGYFALVQVWGAIASAVLLGAVNLVLAAGLLLLALKRPPPRELALALEVENAAISALQAEVRSMHASGFGSFQHPLGVALATVLPRLIPLVIRALKKSKAKPADDDR